MTRTTRGGRGAVVPAAEIRTYYDQPVIKRPVWTWEIPNYFFTGGLAGGAAVLGGLAQVSGRGALATAAGRAALLGTLPSPVLLVMDLGRPARFHHMLRVIKPTSPMSVGSWVLAAFGPAAVGGQLLEELGWFPRLRRVLRVVAGGLGPVMSTYTAVLFCDTAVPVWRDARDELPAIFAASGAAAAGGAVAVMAPVDVSRPARRLSSLAGLAETALMRVMRRRLGDLARPYEEGAAGRWGRVAEVCTVAGSLVTLVAGRRRTGAVLGGVLSMAGSYATRWSVFEAGRQSAEDPAATIGPQRARVRAMDGSAAG